MDPWEYIRSKFRRPGFTPLVDGLRYEPPGSPDRLIASTEAAVTAAVQFHASVSETPLSYEALVTAQVLVREGAYVVVSLVDGGFFLLVPRRRSEIAGRLLRETMRRVVSSTGGPYEEWAWW